MHMGHKPEVKAHTISFKKEKKNVCDFGINKKFLEHRKAQIIKENIDTIDFIKIKSFCSLKDTGVFSVVHFFEDLIFK